MPEPLKSEPLARMRNIQHGFFTREGGCSRRIYQSLNCGLGSADASANVIANRGLVAKHLGSDSDDVVTAYQCHSATAIVIDAPLPGSNLPKADALVTATKGLGIGVLTADCTPVLFADEEAGVVGAAHAGWRGAGGGILLATIEAMEAIGAQRRRIRAAIGPCIHQQNYEVGDDFRAQFVAQSTENEEFFVVPAGRKQPHFDLPRFVRAQLLRADIANPDFLALCTYENESKFFSYRRSQHRSEADYGRQISAIMVA